MLLLVVSAIYTIEEIRPPRDFSAFANGDSTYEDSYNTPDKAIQQLMTKLGCKLLLNHRFMGDSALRTLNWDSFSNWLESMDHLILAFIRRQRPHHV